MQSTAFGSARTTDEQRHARYLDALIGFRPSTCLAMSQGAAEGGGDGTGGSVGGQGGDGAGGGQENAGASGGQGGQGGQGPEMATDGQGRSLGFPKDTPVSDMTDAQQSAYWRNQAQKHEGRYKNLTGDRSFDDTKKALDDYARIQKEQMTPAEQALTEAREAGKSEGLTAARTEAATAVFRGALEAGGITGDDLTELVSNFNVANYIGENGVDTAKIAAFAKRFTPSDKDTLQQRRRDFAGGQRQEGHPARGAAGRAQAVRRGFIKDESKTS